MAVFSVIKLKNWSPVHFGTGRENYDTSSSILHADTITAALAAMKAQTGHPGDVKDFLNSVRLSSAFPYWNNRLFLPKKQGKLPVMVKGEDESHFRKQLKNVNYVEMPLWNKMVAGNMLSVTLGQFAGNLLIDNAEPLPVLQMTQVNERVAVSRNDKDAEPFFFEWNYFEREAGLFVLTDAEDAMLEELLFLFSILGEQGVGTDRSVGGGKFEVELAGNIQLGVTPDVANATMLLSTYLPTEGEIPVLELSVARYNLLLRGGFIAGSQEERYRHLRKRSVYMFGEGSVFPTCASIEGKVVDLRPNWKSEDMHPVYRSGKPLCVPIKIENL